MIEDAGPADPDVTSCAAGTPRRRRAPTHGCRTRRALAPGGAGRDGAGGHGRRRPGHRRAGRSAGCRSGRRPLRPASEIDELVVKRPEGAGALAIGASRASGGGSYSFRREGFDRGMCGARRPPTRIGSTRRARPVRVVGLDEDAADRRRPVGRLVAAAGQAGGEAPQRLFLLVADDAVVVGAGRRRRSGRRCRRAGSGRRRSGTWVWVPTTRLARPSQKWPMAIFSEVASACMSTMMASATAPSGQASSSRSTAANGSSSASMCTRPSRLITRTRWPLWRLEQLGAAARARRIRRG